MLKVNKIPKVLFIKGVFKKDCVTDDMFDKKIMENVFDNKAMGMGFDEQEDFSVSYNKLPATFENIDVWPKTTNLICWNCHQAFNTIPVFIPGVIEPTTSKDPENSKQKFVISVYGVFSSFGCALSFVESRNYPLNEKIEIHNKLNLLHRLFYGTKMTDTNYFPCIYTTIPYGGDKTIDEFRDEMKKFKRENIPVKKN
ncbi:MAG: hypothetical protein ACRCZI_12460 [Cetobacterium sp.]